MLLKVEKSREMYVTHTLSLHYFYTHIPTLKQAILFFLNLLSAIPNLGQYK